MPKWGKPTKNRKRIDPRYFINETTNRDLKEYAMEPPMSEEPPMDEPAAAASPGRFDRLFEKGAPGDVFAEEVGRDLMLDEESDFEAMKQAIKSGLENWYSSRRT